MAIPLIAQRPDAPCARLRADGDVDEDVHGTFGA